ncbi:MAG: hypothetical protein M3Q31_05090, partial [Actinomycetota bacterium]|nr:hypothetical protein [Actinomycetota bacterium]
LDGLEPFAVVAIFYWYWRHSGEAPRVKSLWLLASTSGPIMRHCSDREGHGTSAMVLERLHSRFVPGRKSSENL